MSVSKVICGSCGEMARHGNLRSIFDVRYNRYFLVSLTAFNMLKTNSKRCLIHQVDVLLAISGVLHALGTGPGGFKEIWGVLIPTDPMKLPSKDVLPATLTKERSSLMFLLALGWESDLIDTASLRRRVGFPSWSWCG
jgi:hypothetical protein